MENFELLLFLTLEGIGSASGIVYHKEALYIISDNSSYLYHYKIPEQQLHKIALLENASENTIKKEKLDIEAITIQNETLYLFGSGSTQNRNKNFLYHLENKVTSEKDISNLYQKIKTKFSISEDDLNIEGAVFNGDDLLLFQRGNGSKSTNGVIIIHNYLSVNDFKDISFTSITLPKVKNVEYTFTDAVLVEDKIYFLAAAEDTNSTYDDGEVLGSILGRMDPKTLQVEKTIPITAKHKLEGLTLWEKKNSEFTFLLCEDNDTEVLKSSIYKLRITIAN